MDWPDAHIALVMLVFDLQWPVCWCNMNEGWVNEHLDNIQEKLSMLTGGHALPPYGNLPCTVNDYEATRARSAGHDRCEGGQGLKVEPAIEYSSRTLRDFSCISELKAGFRLWASSR